MTSVEQSRSAPASPRARIGIGAAIVLVILALAITVGIGILRGAAAPVENIPGTGEASGTTRPQDDTFADTDTDTDTDTTMARSVYIHVSGAVVAPGLYVLKDGARVVDALSAAGGFAAGSDEQAVNLARPLSDGEQLHVPLLGEVPGTAAGEAGEAGGSGGASLPAGDGRVNLNTADAAQLDTLPRIGPAMAQRILDWREANGRFTSVEDLLAVPGIGDKMLEALRDLVSI